MSNHPNALNVKNKNTFTSFIFDVFVPGLSQPQFKKTFNAFWFKNVTDTQSSHGSPATTEEAGETQAHITVLEKPRQWSTHLPTPWFDICRKRRWFGASPHLQVWDFGDSPNSNQLDGKIWKNTQKKSTQKMPPPKKTIYMISNGVRDVKEPFFFQRITPTSWWFQPIWKILVKLDHFPK